MNPFPLNRLVRVHRVPRAGSGHTENGPMVRSPRHFAYAANPRLSPMAQPSTRGVKSRKGILDLPPR